MDICPPLVSASIPFRVFNSCNHIVINAVVWHLVIAHRKYSQFCIFLLTGRLLQVKLDKDNNVGEDCAEDWNNHWFVHAEKSTCSQRSLIKTHAPIGFWKWNFSFFSGNYNWLENNRLTNWPTDQSTDRHEDSKIVIMILNKENYEYKWYNFFTG